MVPLRLAVACALASGVAAQQLIASSDPNYQYIGRFKSGPAGTMMFDMPGCEIRASLTLAAASKVSVKLAQLHGAVPPHPDGNTKNSGFESNAFVVFVDGVRQGAGGFNATFGTSKDQTEAPYLYGIGDAPLAAGTHEVRILKATEADWNGGSPVPNYVTFYGLQVAAASEGATAAAAATLAPAPPLPTRKIEFLGDSITAGFCNECQHQRNLPAGHNEAYGSTWDYQIAQLCDAQLHTAAWSGLGMVKNCCGGNTTMPSVFSRTLATVNVDDTWDWARWRADALVINLGTNDGAAGKTPHYVSTYTNVVMQASAHYGPDLHVFLACGPMSETYCDSVHEVLSAVSQKGVKAHFLDQRGFLNGSFGKACCGHPGIEVDTAMAKSGAASIKTALGWN